MSFNAADRKDIRRAEKAARTAEVLRHDHIRHAMSTPLGRAWFWTLLKACHIFETSWAPEPLTIAFREGERNIGLLIVADIFAACPEQYLLMTQEANAKEFTNGHRNNPNPNDAVPDEPTSGEQPGSPDAGGDVIGPGEPTGADDPYGEWLKSGRSTYKS